MIINLADKVLSRTRLSRWMISPVNWARDCLPTVDLAPYQREVLDELPRKKRVALRGPHGLGKSFLGAVLVNWFASTRDLAGVEWKVITTASAWRHLEVYLWPEIHKWSNKIDFETLGRAPYNLRTELLDLRMKLRHGAATAVASDQPERIEGAHAIELLYLLDEAKIIPPATWDAIEGAFSNAGSDTTDNAYAFAMSTPGAPSGRFYEIHRRAPGLEDWWTRHITLDESIAAGRISRQWADQRERQWGRDSAMFANRVLGEFHASSEDSVIPLAWLEAAIERWHEWDRAGRRSPGGPLWMGVDVGRGGDETVLARRDGWTITLEPNRCRDTMRTVALVQGLDGRAIVDAVGLGAGVFDRLREVGAKPLAYVGSGKTTARDRSKRFGFVNCLAGDSPVRTIGDLRRVYRARYEGSLFKVETSRGDYFTATANHQVMTPGGWVSVQSLRVGDQLCDPFLGNPAGRVSPAWPEVNDVPSEIGEIYRAADRLFGSKRVEGGAVNFHGDTPVGDVEVVTINRDLLAVGETGGEAAQDVQFIRSLLGPGSLANQCAADPVPTNYVVNIELTTSTPHNDPYVYTLETSTGTYRSQHTTHKNCRSAAYWRVRELLDPAYDPVLALPPDELMISDLTTPTWDVVTGIPPKIKVETKDRVVERLGRSPDRGDAIAMSLWADRQTTGQHVEPSGNMPVTGLSPLG